jgi:hypothetical protein
VVWFGLKKTQNRQIDLRYLADLSELLSAPNASIDASNGASFECWPESWRAFWCETETLKSPRFWSGLLRFDRTGFTGLTGFSLVLSHSRTGVQEKPSPQGQ